MVRKFKEENSKVQTVEDAVAFVYRFQYRRATIRPLQVEEEIFSLVKKLAAYTPKIVLEIGTSHGGTLYLFTRISSPDALMISIDLRGARFGGGYSRLRIPLLKSLGTQRQQIRLINANSHDPSTLKRVESLLHGKPVDFLFIDADHTYEGVKADFETYSKLVVPRGIIALHDIVDHPADRYVGVHRFWNEIKPEYKHEEIVIDPKQGWAGIGLVYKPD